MRRVRIFFLLAAAGIITFKAVYCFTELYYDRDLAGYVYNCLDLLRGRGWYYSVWHTKPPGINFIILAAFKFFGTSFKSIYLLALFFNLLSAAFIYLFAKKILLKETKFYFLLPVFFAFLFAGGPFQTYSANTEVFLAPFEIAGILFLSLNQFFIAGLCLGLGFLIRTSGVFTFIAGAIFIFAAKSLEAKSFKAPIKNFLSFAGAFILPLALACLYFLSWGVFDKFLDYTFIYNLRHLGGYFTEVRQNDLFFTKRIFWNSFGFELIIFGLLALVGFFSTLLKRTKPRLLIGLWFGVICLGLFKSAIYPHHFNQIIAPLACISLLGAGDVFEGIKRLFRRKVYFKNMASIILIAILIIPAIRLAASFDAKKKPDFALGAKGRFLAAQYIKERALPEDKLFVWDSFDTGAIHLWSKLDSVTKFYEKDAFLPAELIEHWVPYSKDYKLNQQQLLLDLKQNPPKYIIVVLDYGRITRWKRPNDAEEAFELEKNSFAEFFRFLDENYQWDKGVDNCRIYRLGEWVKK